MKQRLDTYDRIPPAMADYLSQYGWHFSKKMENKSTGKEEKLEPISKEQVEELLKKYSINLEKDAGYDSVYVANMAKKGSITDEAHLALFIKDYIDDVDAYNGMPFTRFYADCIGSGNPIMWEQMM